MLPFEWADEDKEIAEELELESPRDLEKFKDEYFVSDMFYNVPLEDLKEIVKDTYKKCEEMIKQSENPDPRELNAIIYQFMAFEVFRIENFIANPNDDTIWLELYSWLYDTEYGPQPLRSGVIVNRSELSQLRNKALQLSTLIEELFFKGFGKKLNISKENIKNFYQEQREDLKEDKDWESLLTEEDRQFLKDFRIKSSKKK